MEWASNYDLIPISIDQPSFVLTAEHVDNATFFMTTSIELDNLAEKREERRIEAEKLAQENSNDEEPQNEVQNATIAAWAWTTASM